jgi:GT2 family glycosyltransferase
MTPRPLISTIILNWNGREQLYACIQSVKKQTYTNMEIILVDNASTDGSVEYIRTLFPDLQLIVNPSNLGYGGGNNRGIRESKGPFIFILNNDTEIETECVESLWKSIETDRRIGAVTPKIVLHDRRNTIDAGGVSIYPDGLSIGRGHLEPQEKYCVRQEVFFGSGCASLFRKEMLNEIGLFDEHFFAYAEDTDLGWRARLAGWKAYYVPEAIVYHHHSKRFGAYSPRKAFLVERNRIWVAIKNFPLPLLLLGQGYTLWRYLFQAYGALTGKGAAGRFTDDFPRMELVKILTKVYLSLWKDLPLLFEKRRAIQRKRRISNREVFELMERFGISTREIALRE